MVFWLYFLAFTGLTTSEFLVNVRTKDGNVIKQTIRENITDSSITLEYQDWDLTKVTQVVDFKSSLNVFQIIIYGEVELNQPPVQILCFISHLSSKDFIEPDAVSKLRQKNQDTIRISEVTLAAVLKTAEYSVSLSASHLLSHHIDHMCSNTNGFIFTTDEDIQNAAKDSGKDYETMLSSTKRLTAMKLLPCHDVSAPSAQCTCRYHFNVDWYPCSLKYCKGVVGDKPTTYKCGIKTCGIKRQYEFPISHKSACWFGSQ